MKDVCLCHSHRGCPILAFFARACPEPALSLPKGWAAMMPVLFRLSYHTACTAPAAASRDRPFAQPFPSPALRKEREGRRTHYVGNALRDQKSGPPALLERKGRVARQNHATHYAVFPFCESEDDWVESSGAVACAVAQYSSRRFLPPSIVRRMAEYPTLAFSPAQGPASRNRPV